MYRPDIQESADCAVERNVSVALLGECRVSIGGNYLKGVPAGFYRIAAYLLLKARDQPQFRRGVGGLLWSDKSSTQVSADIRQTVARIRRFQSDQGFGFITADTTTLWLAKDENVSCDMIDFLDLLDNPSPASAPRLCELYDGELLGSLGSAGVGYEDWLSFQRSTIDNELITAVSQAILPGSGLPRDQRDFCAYRLLRMDPCDELAYRALMLGAAEGGRTSAVQDLFDECRRKLSTELGVGPDRQTVQLYEELTKDRATTGP